MKYTKKYDWDAVDEVKGWEKKNMRDSLHKVTVEEKETGKNKTQTFNFSPSQTSGDVWKKHVDQWVEGLTNNKGSSVLQ